jgi:predicted transcriptional regulator
MTIGRPPRARDKIAEIGRLWKRGVEPNEIAKLLGISRPSVYRYAPISVEDRYLRSLRGEANRQIRRKQREMGMDAFRKGFPEMLEDYLIDEGADEVKIDEAMSTIGVDMTLWADNKSKLLEDAAEKTLRYEAMKKPEQSVSDVDDKSDSERVRELADQLRGQKKSQKVRDFSKLKF